MSRPKLLTLALIVGIGGAMASFPDRSTSTRLPGVSLAQRYHQRSRTRNFYQRSSLSGSRHLRRSTRTSSGWAFFSQSRSETTWQTYPATQIPMPNVQPVETMSIR
ncbi:hypothetical protein CA13_01170 [Planctomycetes bacterium CA13]|uniref:Uncharacterized protein n=1 Tax=Novipirellula herctigrandis TaxID=2527986 RepID=A0A5C5YV58_9BACT|nr:hypothetical protein CA13_01170 [Planctomycetes bacterium CA13]